MGSTKMSIHNEIWVGAIKNPAQRITSKTVTLRKKTPEDLVNFREESTAVRPLKQLADRVRPVQSKTSTAVEPSAQATSIPAAATSAQRRECQRGLLAAPVPDRPRNRLRCQEFRVFSDNFARKRFLRRRRLERVAHNGSV
jgi:hypothetical protein